MPELIQMIICYLFLAADRLFNYQLFNLYAEFNPKTRKLFHKKNPWLIEAHSCAQPGIIFLYHDKLFSKFDSLLNNWRKSL
jgi:hypothetical protein